MARDATASWLLEQEARALLTRLDAVRPFVLQETTLPAAAVSPGGLAAIEEYLLAGRREVRGEVRRFLRWIGGEGHQASPAQQQRRFTLMRLKFNIALAQFDMFSEVITQRSEHGTGLWLSGLDVAAAEALVVPGGYFEAPPIVCHLHRGLGGAIRRARTRLPGGGRNPASIVRIPRERMIGYGIGSSLVHEVGHQGAALLGLVESLRAAVEEAGASGPDEERQAWDLWGRWVSEVIADFWSVAKIGAASTLGLMGLVSLPRAFVFRLDPLDPHPVPWIRVLLSCAIGEALYPDPQWASIASVWEELYPTRGLHPRLLDVMTGLYQTLPAFVSLLVSHRPAALRGRALGRVLRSPDRAPPALIATFRRWSRAPDLMSAAAPTLAFAVFGQARASGLISPELESRLLEELIGEWALRSTLATNASFSTVRVPMPGGQPVIWAREQPPYAGTHPVPALR
jgi:hypothetical protein